MNDTKLPPSQPLSYDDFLKVDIRVGRIIAVKEFAEARVPAYKLTIDFGPELGHKDSSAQLTKNYSKTDLVDKLVAAVVNFAPKKIAGFSSQVLVLGFPDVSSEPVLPTLSDSCPVGGRLY